MLSSSGASYWQGHAQAHDHHREKSGYIKNNPLSIFQSINESEPMQGFIYFTPPVTCGGCSKIMSNSRPPPLGKGYCFFPPYQRWDKGERSNFPTLTQPSPLKGEGCSVPVTGLPVT